MEDKYFTNMGDLILGPPDFDFVSTLNALKLENVTTETLSKLTNDDLASEHYATFGMTVFPFGHYYTSEGRNFAGDDDYQLIKLYQQNSFDYESVSYGMGATHLGTMLHFVQFTKEKNLPHLRREFIVNHLLTWIRTFSLSLEELDSIFKFVIKDVEQKVYFEWESLNGPEHLDEINFRLPDFDIFKDLLEVEKTSLKDIGEYFITPARAGFFISKPTLVNFAQKLNIPIGFGDRSLIVGDIMREASNYEVMDEFTKMLLTYCEYLEKNYKNFPVETIAKSWTSKILQTKLLIQEIKSSLS